MPFSPPQIKSILKTYGVGIALAVLLAVTFRTMVLEAFKIPTSVMKPTLEPGDFVFVRKTQDVTAGDVVTFESTVDGRSMTFIKRIVGVAGDRVRIEAGRVWVNEKQLDFKVAESAVCGSESLGERDYKICLEPPLIPNRDITTVSDGEIFVIGDARTAGLSRLDHGLIQKNQITGRAKWIWLSLDPLESQQSWIPRFRFNRMFLGIDR